MAITLNCLLGDYDLPYAKVARLRLIDTGSRRVVAKKAPRDSFEGSR